MYKRKKADVLSFKISRKTLNMLKELKKKDDDYMYIICEKAVKEYMNKIKRK